MEKERDALSEERIKKIKERTEQLQDKAALLKEARERKKQKKMEEKIKTRIKERKAVSESTDPHDIKRIIKEGTPEERAYLIIRSYDNKNFGLKGILELTEKQIKAIKDGIKTEEEYDLFNSYIRLYFDLREYKSELYKFVKLYQVGIGLLAKVVTQWDGYNKMAETLTALLVDGRSEEEIQNKLSSLSPVINNEFVKYKYDPEKKAIVADIFFKGGLYEKIKKEQHTAEEFLRMAKACIVVIEEYISVSDFFLVVPMSMEMSIDNVKNETYSRYLISKEHHLSEINYRRIDKGEPVSPEEELLAVVPDYYEVKPDEEFYEICKNGLSKIRKKCS